MTDRRRALLRRTVNGGLLALLATAVTSANAFCFEEAAVRYGVSADLLKAIARVESSMNPAAVNDRHFSATGSVDIGLMQINSRHLDAGLRTTGITKKDLLSDPCLNTMVGAWILADHLRRHGQDWNGVGSYNAACTQLKGAACTEARNRYAWKVYRALQRDTAAKSTRTPQAQPGPTQRVALIQPRPIASADIPGPTPGAMEPTHESAITQ